jgi:hypothetical protein
LNRGLWVLIPLVSSLPKAFGGGTLIPCSRMQAVNLSAALCDVAASAGSRCARGLRGPGGCCRGCWRRGGGGRVGECAGHFISVAVPRGGAAARRQSETGDRHRGDQQGSGMAVGRRLAVSRWGMKLLCRRESSTIVSPDLWGERSPGVAVTYGRFVTSGGAPLDGPA